MNPWAIVAIPKEDDYVWKISSEKVPHLTLLVLGEHETTDMPTELEAHIATYLEHVVNTSMCRFGLSVDRRGILGDKNADVLFFDHDQCVQELDTVRSILLSDPRIKDEYESMPQFVEWQPHLTLGFPETPAKEDTRDYPGIHWVEFDRVAFWTGDFQGRGPQFVLPHRQHDLLMSDLQKSFDLSRKVQDIDLTHDRVFDESKVNRKGGKFAPKGTSDLVKTDEEWAKGENLRKIHERILKARGIEIAQSTKAILEKHGLKPGDSLDGHPKAQRQILTAAVQIMNTASKTLGVSPSGASRLNFAVNKAGDHIYLASVPNKDVHRVGGRRVEHSTNETEVLSFDIDVSDDDVLQFGRLGMKWGVRRARGSDGKVHGTVTASDAAQAAAIRAKIGRKGNLSKLSNEDIQKLATRINLENNLARAATESSKLTKGHSAVKTGLALGKTANEAIKFYNSDAGQLLRAAVGGDSHAGKHNKLNQPISLLANAAGAGNKGKRKKGGS